MYKSSTSIVDLQNARITPTFLGPEDDSNIVDGVGLFEREMYMSGMHGGHSRRQDVVV